MCVRMREKVGGGGGESQRDRDTESGLMVIRQTTRRTNEQTEGKLVDGASR